MSKFYGINCVRQFTRGVTVQVSQNKYGNFLKIYFMLAAFAIEQQRFQHIDIR